MHRHQLRDALDLYRQSWEAGRIPYPHFDRREEEANRSGIHQFIAAHPDCFERSCRVGHITGSAMVASPGLDRVLLTLHAKLGKWLQLGGHTDGASDVLASAWREAREESGSSAVRPWPLSSFPIPGVPASETLPFDLDIHAIPARGSDETHFHFDVRYLFVLDPDRPLQLNHESKDLRWLTLTEARSLTEERSMLRQFDKLEALASRRTGG